MFKHILGAAVVASLLTSACAGWSANTQAARPYTDWGRPAPRNSMDNDYAQRALAIGLDQVQLSRLALERSNNPAVHKFAKRQILDHSRFNEAMLEISDEQGLPLPPARVDAQGEELLVPLSGAGFDAAYLALMMVNLEEAYALQIQEERLGQEIRLKVNAEMQKDPLGEHLSEVRRLFELYG